MRPFPPSRPPTGRPSRMIAHRIARPIGRPTAALRIVTLAAVLALGRSRLGALAAEADPNRLGNAAAPTFQAIQLDLDADKTDYTGRTRIELKVLQPASALRFHAEGLKLDKVTLTGPAGAIRTTFTVGENAIVVLTPLTRSMLMPGDYVLAIEFSNVFDTQATSLYRLKAGEHAYTFTQFESDDAREAFPCWDEPEFKIPFQITLTVPKDHLAISNTPVDSETVAGDHKTVVFQRTRPLPAYLLAIATGPFDVVPIPDLGVPGNVITVKGSGGLAAEAVRMAPPLLEALEHYFDRPYPYEKLDLLAVPEFWPGAMENAGAITFADRILLIDPQSATVAQRRSLASVMAHEMAHMWFGDLVTMKWWDDLWLNESFATWMGNKVTDAVFPEYQLGVTSVLDVQRAMEQDANLTTRAIHQPVVAGENLVQEADGLTYEKGAAVLGMFETWMGEEPFRKGVLDYLERFAWRNAQACDLWAALARAGGQDVGAAMTGYLDQKGVPLVSARLLPDGSVELSQTRALHYGVQDAESAARLWTIPVFLSWGDGAQTQTQTVLLTQRSQVVELPKGIKPAWIHPDSGERGYYRWSVPPDLLTAMASRAAAILSPRERVGLTGHVGALLEAGEIHADTYLRSLEELADDPQPEVVDAVLSHLGGVRAAFVTAELESDFARYVRRLAAPSVTRFGLEAKEGEPETVPVLRAKLLMWLGRWGHDEAALQRSRTLADSYFKDRHSVDPSLVGTALSLAALNGDWKLYNQLKTGFETTEIPAERGRYLAAMGCFLDAQYLKAALRYTVTGPLRPQELFTVVFGMGTVQLDPGPMLWDWMTGNYDAIAARIPPTFMAYMPFFASGCDQSRLAAAREFFADEKHKVAGTDKTLEQVAESVTHCAQLRDREGKAVSAYLRQAVGLR
jgi:alanyl aminopeptidase